MSILKVMKCQHEDCMETNITTNSICPSCGGKRVKNSPPDTPDYITAWESDLENANRHSLTDMPSELYETLFDHIKDKKVLLKIFAELYEKGLGV